MWNNGKELKKQLINLEKMREGIMLQINRLNENKDAIMPTKVFPVGSVKLHEINNYPVIQFNYEGLLPLYIEESEYIKLIRNYYFHATISAYDYEGLENILGDQVVIIYCQYFKDNSIRDLENRNFKYIQDAIRATCLVADDNWKNVWNMNIGFMDEEKNHVQVYVVDRRNYADFYAWLEENHHQLKNNKEFPFDKQEFLKKYRKIIEENEQKKSLKYKERGIESDVTLDWYGS